MNTPAKIIIHHTAVSRAKAPVQFQAVNRYHKELWNYESELGLYGGYHLFIEADGTVLRYRNDHEVGAHTIGENNRSIGICLSGNFDVEMPTTAQVNALRKLLIELVTKYPRILYKDIFPHRQFANKTCYGMNLANDWASKLASTVPTVDEVHEAELLAKVSKFDVPRDMVLRLIRAIISSRKK